MSRMELGLCIRDGVGYDLGQQMEQAKRLGFDRVQIALWSMDHLTKEYALQTKELLKRNQLTCTEVWCGWEKPAIWDFKSGPASLGLVPMSHRAIRTRNLLDGGLFARELGVTDVITHLGFIPQDPFDPNYVGLIIALKHITAEYAKEGLVFSFETGQETPVLVARCIEDTGASNMGVNYDPANLLIYGNANPIDGLNLLGKYVRSVHAKDGTYPTGGYITGVETVMGEGEVNMEAFVSKLKNIDFSGTISIEHERKGLSDEEKEREILSAKSLLEKLL